MDSLSVIFASIISALGTVLAVYIKHRIDYKRKSSIENTTISGANIYEALEFIQGETGCARAYVFEFHNGEHFFSGRGQQKFSCTYEYVRAGVSSEAMNSQGHRISNYNKYMHNLITEGFFNTCNINDLEDQAFRSLLSRKGVMAIYNVPIKTLNGKIIGVLGIDYICKLNEFDFGAQHPDSLKFMQRQARVISGYLI
jgi:hypothetical protein